MKRLCLLAILATTAAFAEEPSIGIRSTFGIGAWDGVFTQSSPGQSVKLVSPGSLGVEATAGIRIGFAFAEYAVEGFSSQLSGGSNPADAVYYSLFGGNFGISFPDFPVEGYFGFSNGNYNFTAGSIGTFNGLTLKAGVDFLLKAQSGLGIGLRAEYRRMLIYADQAGPYPSGVGAGADVFFLGLTLGYYGPKSAFMQSPAGNAPHPAAPAQPAPSSSSDPKEPR